MYLEITITAIVALVVGILIGRFLLVRVLHSLKEKADNEAKQILQTAKADAANLLKEKELSAKDHFLQLQADHQRETNKRQKGIAAQEAKLKKQEQRFQQIELKLKEKEVSLNKEQELLNKELQKHQQRKDDLHRKIEAVELKMEDAKRVEKEKIALLEKVSGLSAEEAKNQLIESLEKEAHTLATAKIRQIMSDAELTATKDAKRLVLSTIQRTATEHAIENCVSVFHLESDDIKGKIIGREGRNIRALEAATGVEIIVDDTPEAITISGFDPVRREIARLSLHRLVADGRVHPARIEEVVAKTTEQLEEQIIELGERAVIELGIHGLHLELIKLVGKMRFRSSYGQNLLQHSKEVTRLCATMASEMGLNVKLAKRAGLLHDIGKVCTEDPDKPHAILGMELAQRYGEHPEVCNAIGAHHDEIEMTSMLSPVVQACDAISGSRPGARRETMESYIQRLQDLENLATSYTGVNKCYAIQAGRELRVIVDSENVMDDTADEIAFKISQQIQTEMQYPGQVKVTVIREKRAVHYAK